MSMIVESKKNEKSLTSFNLGPQINSHVGSVKGISDKWYSFELFQHPTHVIIYFEIFFYVMFVVINDF